MVCIEVWNGQCALDDGLVWRNQDILEDQWLCTYHLILCNLEKLNKAGAIVNVNSLFYTFISMHRDVSHVHW